MGIPRSLFLEHGLVDPVKTSILVLESKILQRLTGCSCAENDLFPYLHQAESGDRNYLTTTWELFLTLENGTI